MNMRSSWEFAGEFPQAPPSTECENCHDCIPFYEPTAARVIRALQLPVDDGVTADLGERYPMLRYINPLPARQIRSYYAQLDRIARISGLYAAGFRWLESLGVQIPFVGAAAFASNVVRWEVADLVHGYGNTVYEQERRGMNTTGRHDLNAITGVMNKLIAGNAVVFVEIFAIFDFCVRHFRRFGRPRTEAEIAEFETCLGNFIMWWDEVQPGNRMFRQMRDIQVDRDGLIKDGIIASLRAETGDARRAASTDMILYNEQNYTLQEYMYDLIDSDIFGIIPFDPAEIGLLVRGYRAAAKFSYEKDAQVADRFIVAYDRSGWLTEAADRYPYTIEVVSQFDRLYFDGGDRRYLGAEHGRMAADARGF
ncbi:hypothetical protein C8N43_0101 [Litoreibacter ponti]|uniref:Uncharacterized protein n=1 Tax=Litoreibacter ponti TaxID=1510457 RepID=A0A2T6BHB5_9RHOB|nr:hypothetical protein [Litoreibacter ponti]PTX55463.1 hypothetical protein C8N43_0101 [Litoreibacter ponti]